MGGRKGPRIALVATCRRLRWVVKDAVNIVTDDGKELQPHLDSPAAVCNKVKMAVRRWRWRALETSMPQLAKGGNGAGALMAPVWNLLKPKQNDGEWNPACRGGLRSALSGRQYPKRGSLLWNGPSTTDAFYDCTTSFKTTL